jgi:cell division protein FtsW
MTCAALGLLLRVSYELDRAQRQVARVRNDNVSPTPNEPNTSSPVATPLGSRKPSPAVVSSARGTSRLQQRVEPTLGRIA